MTPQPKTTIFYKGQHISFATGPQVPNTPAEQFGPAKRAGAWKEFERRFDPVSIEEGWMIHPHYLTGDLPTAHIWTVIEGDNGRLYVVEGWHYVNRLGYIVARNPRIDGCAYKTFLYD